MADPLRLMIYDRTQKGRSGLPGLTFTWKVGAKLFGAIDRFDASYGAESWNEALNWLAAHEPDRKIAEIQFWGHGRWGTALINGERLDASTLNATDPRSSLLARIRARLSGPEALWWFRTCETFGMKEGHDFARAWSRYFNCRVAGHTYVIWVAQSGLHVLEPGAEPDWPLDEGLPNDGKPPEKARWSTPFAGNTISFLTSRLPGRR